MISSKRLELGSLLGRIQRKSWQREITVQLALLGSIMAGKTSLINRYCHGTFADLPRRTISLDMVIKTIIPEFKSGDLGVKGDRSRDLEFKVIFWDFAGEFSGFTYSPFNSLAEVLLLCFDRNSLFSFYYLEDRMSFVKQVHPAALTALVATKNDLDQVVERQEIDAFMDRHAVTGGFFPTSAKTGNGVRELFNAVILDVLEMKLNDHGHGHPLPERDG